MASVLPQEVCLYFLPLDRKATSQGVHRTQVATTIASEQSMTLHSLLEWEISLTFNISLKFMFHNASFSRGCSLHTISMSSDCFTQQSEFIFV